MFYEHDVAYINLEPGSFPFGNFMHRVGLTTWQLSSVARPCSSSLPHISTLERLDIREAGSPGRQWQDDMENVQTTCRLFTAARYLYLDKELALYVVPGRTVPGEEITGRRARSEGIRGRAKGVVKQDKQMGARRQVAGLKEQ